MNQTEYEWIKQTRGLLLSFLEELEQDALTRQMNGFGFANIRDLLVHVADCYNAWLGSFVLLKTKKPLTAKEKLQSMDLEEIKVRFELVDSLVKEVLVAHDHPLHVPITRKIPWREVSEVISMTPSKLLVHTITHEFHHKGQIVAMIRHMGFEPPYTDVLGTKD